jgi:hypothetical protein
MNKIIEFIKQNKSKFKKFDPLQFAMGIQIEMEHHEGPEEAAKIAADHLKENSRYYFELKSAGLIDENLKYTTEIKEILMKKAYNMKMIELYSENGKKIFLKINNDEMEKARAMPIGTTATWGDGKQYKKVSDKVWEPVSGHGNKSYVEAPKGGKEKDEGPLTPSKLHEKFRIAIEGMSSEHRAIFRGGKLDFEHKKFVSNDGKMALEYKDGKMNIVKNEKMEKAISESIYKHSNKLGAGAKKRKGLSPKDKFDAVMHEFGRGTLHSSDGKIVTNREQAIAIAYSESGEKHMEEDDEEILQKASFGERPGHKYIKRWKGKGGDWLYEYPDSKKHHGDETNKESIKEEEDKLDEKVKKKETENIPEQFKNIKPSKIELEIISQGRKYFKVVNPGKTFQMDLYINDSSKNFKPGDKITINALKHKEENKYGVKIQIYPISDNEIEEIKEKSNTEINKKELDRWMGYVREAANKGYIYDKGVERLKQLGINKVEELLKELKEIHVKVRNKKDIEKINNYLEYMKEAADKGYVYEKGLQTLKILGIENYPEKKEKLNKILDSIKEKKQEQENKNKEEGRGKSIFPDSKSPQLNIPIKSGNSIIVYEKQGKSFKIDENMPSIYFETLGHEGEWGSYYYYRKATEDEIKQYNEKQEKIKKENEIKNNFNQAKEKIEKLIQDKGEYFKSEQQINLKGTVYFDTMNIYGGGSYLLIDDNKEYIWNVENNGMDGDNWSKNNIRTGGAGAIGYRIKFEGDVKDYFQKLLDANELLKSSDILQKAIYNKIQKADRPGPHKYIKDEEILQKAYFGEHPGHKYIKRWKGRGGDWLYEYPDSKKHHGDETNKESIVEFPSKRVESAYSSVHLSPSNTAKVEKKYFEDVTKEIKENIKKYIPDIDETKLEGIIENFQKEYLSEREKIWKSASSMFSSAVAGRSNFNKKQADFRGRGLDRSQDNFDLWIKEKTNDIESLLGIDKIKKEENKKKEESTLNKKEKIKEAKVEYWNKLKVGDEIPLGNPNGNPRIAKKSEFSVTSSSGVKYSMKELLGLDHSEAREIMSKKQPDKSEITLHKNKKIALSKLNPKIEEFKNHINSVGRNASNTNQYALISSVDGNTGEVKFSIKHIPSKTIVSNFEGTISNADDFDAIKEKMSKELDKHNNEEKKSPLKKSIFNLIKPNELIRKNGTSQQKMYKAAYLLFSELQKAKKAEVGAVHTYSDGSKWRKVGPGKWEPVKEGKKPKSNKNTDEKKTDKKKPDQQKKSDSSGKRGIMRDALKKVADILANALSAKETVPVTGEAIEKTGESLSEKKKENIKNKNISNPTREKDNSKKDK